MILENNLADASAKLNNYKVKLIEPQITNFDEVLKEKFY